MPSREGQAVLDGVLTGRGDRTPVTTEHATRLRRRLGWATLVGGLLVVLFWTLYLSGVGEVRGEHPLLAAFESAFLVADTLLAILLFAAGLALLAGRPAGPFLLIAAAGMTFYLGVVDVTFYVRHGLYGAPAAVRAPVELIVNALCIGGGVWGLRAGWLLWGER